MVDKLPDRILEQCSAGPEAFDSVVGAVVPGVSAKFDFVAESVIVVAMRRMLDEAIVDRLPVAARPSSPASASASSSRRVLQRRRAV